jgi:hypothetical protein
MGVHIRVFVGVIWNMEGDGPVGFAGKMKRERKG